jgi:hypothetical protein
MKRNDDIYKNQRHTNNMIENIVSSIRTLRDIQDDCTRKLSREEGEGMKLSKLLLLSTLKENTRWLELIDTRLKFFIEQVLNNLD